MHLQVATGVLVADDKGCLSMMGPQSQNGGAAKSDLAVRTISAIVMILVAGGALWVGGLLFTLFVAAIGLGLLWEFWGLVRKIGGPVWKQLFWLVFGVLYIGVACTVLVALRSPFLGMAPALMLIGAVVATDVGAYFAGRTFGGPKIAPSISPSKTWSGLLGGMMGAALSLILPMPWTYHGFDMAIWPEMIILPAIVGAAIAITAQAGDFFQSWLKRRAGVKDSGHLIPGHGGLFDRADGMIAVLFVTSFVLMIFAGLE